MKEDRTLSFSQRGGYEKLPPSLQLEELPGTARRAIWNVLYGQMEASRHFVVNAFLVRDPWRAVLRDLHSYHDNEPLDEWSENFNELTAWMRHRLETDPFNRLFDVIEFLMRHEHCPREFTTGVAQVFRRFQLAYIIDSGPPPVILPAATSEEGDELSRNLVELRTAGLDGCAAHLRTASRCINGGDAAGSVRESIHAVESVARQIDPRASKGLGAALTSLEQESALHPAFKQAISQLYGYTSDEQGIRHALLDKVEANVTIDEALFMLGACASFASYLWRKHKAATGR